MDITARLEVIKGVGSKTAEALEKRGFRTLKDLLYYFPRSYEDYQSQTNIVDIKPGRVIIRGKIRNLKPGMECALLLSLLNVRNHFLRGQKRSHSKKVTQMTFFWNESLAVRDLYRKFGFQKSVTNDIFWE